MKGIKTKAPAQYEKYIEISDFLEYIKNFPTLFMTKCVIEDDDENELMNSVKSSIHRDIDDF